MTTFQKHLAFLCHFVLILLPIPQDVEGNPNFHLLVNLFTHIEGAYKQGS